MWRDFSRDDLINDIRLILCVQVMHSRVLGASDATIEKWLGVAAANTLPDVHDGTWFEAIRSDANLLASIDIESTSLGEFILESFNRISGESELNFCDIDEKNAYIFLNSLPKVADEGNVPRCLSESGPVRLMLEHVGAAGRIWNYFTGASGWISVKALAHLAKTSEQTVRNALSQRKTELPTYAFEGGVAVRISAAIPWLAGRRGFKAAQNRFSGGQTYLCLCKPVEKADKPHAWLRSLAIWNCGLPPVIAKKAGLSTEIVERILAGDVTVDRDALSAFAEATLIHREALLKAFADGFQDQGSWEDVR